MPRERFEVYVVPQTPGTVEEILSRAPQGAQVRENYITGIEKLRDEMVKGLRGRRRRELLEWAERDTPARVEYCLDFSEKVSSRDKARVLLPSINVMREISQERGLALPPAETMLSWVHIVDEQTLKNAGAQETKDDTFYREAPLGVSLPNKLCLLNHTALSALPVVQSEMVMRQIGIHELWETLRYEELWIKNGEETDRRMGIMTERPKDEAHGKIASGYHRLKEGFIEYITHLTLQRAGEPIAKKRLYEAEVNIAKKLVERIGDDPLFQAMYTKRGFRSLYLALVDKYGKGAYQRLGQALAEDHARRYYGFKLDMPSSYSKTKRFLDQVKSGV